MVQLAKLAISMVSGGHGGDGPFQMSIRPTTTLRWGRASVLGAVRGRAQERAGAVSSRDRSCAPQPRCMLPSCAVVRMLGISKASRWNNRQMCRLEAGFARG